MTELSIVMPTRGRPAILAGSLAALARQEASPGRFEVIVVADGEDQESFGEARDLEVPFELSLLSQPRGGAASARNRGIREARAPIILFLDDDMTASRGLVSEHLRQHSDPSTDVVLGHFSQCTHSLSDPFFAAQVHTWWNRRFRDLARPGHRFSYDDLFAGHFSVKRELVSGVGGFNERFTHAHSGEDYELGVKLLAAGARFAYAPRARAVHMDDPTVRRTLRRVFADGRGHVIVAREHPEIIPGLPLGKPMYDWRKMRPARSKMPRVPALPLAVARSLKLRRMWSALFGRAHTRAYWAGVLTELGSYGELRGLFQEAELTPASEAGVAFDVRDGFSGLVDALGGGDVRSLDVWVGETPICRIPRVDGAEPLRPVHVVEWLASNYAWLVVQALGSEGWRLDGVAPEKGRELPLGKLRHTSAEAGP